MKIRLTIAGSLIFVLLSIIWLLSDEAGRRNNAAARPAPHRDQDKPEKSEIPTKAPSDSGQAPMSNVFSPAVEYRWNARQEAEHKKALPFHLLGLGSGAARVVDSKGKVLMGSSQGREIFSLDVSPDMSRFVVSLGDGKSQIYDSRTARTIALPAAPAMPNMLGFSSWKWVSDDLLITTSGKQALDALGSPVHCCEGHNVAFTQLFAFRPSTGELTPVMPPDSVTAPVFSITRVSSDGHVQFVAEGNHLTPGKSMGWFRITAR